MGFVTDSIRLRQLNGERMDLKYKIQQIAASKKDLTSVNNDLIKVGTDYDPDSPLMKTIQQRQDKIKILEEKLNQEMHDYQLQLDVVEAEYKSCKERVRSEIQEEFSYSL